VGGKALDRALFRVISAVFAWRRKTHGNTPAAQSITYQSKETSNSPIQI